MPQSKQKRKPRAGTAAADAAKSRADAVRDVLAKGVILTTERLQETMDDAVRRGRMTRSDAEDLVALLVSLGRKQTEDLLAELENLAGTPRRARDRTTDRVKLNLDRARRVTGLGSAFPIDGYDDLTAAKITERLDDLSDAELRKVADYERAHGNRKSVLGAVERKLR